MRLRTVLLVAALLAAPALAGCFGSEVVPNERTFSASGGKVSAGWAYDGVNVTAGSASLEGSAVNDANSGSASASFQWAGSSWEVQFDEYAGSQDFMDGGVAFELVEHGDTGVADASIPRILAKVAAWGTATLTRDGEPVLGASGAERWTAHLMLSDTTVRGADGKITKADGTTPYDPAAPADARRVDGQPQAFLVLKSPDGQDAKRDDVDVSGTAAFLGPESTQTIAVPAERGGKVSLTLSADAGDVPLAAGQVTFRLVDEEGNVLASTPQGSVLPNQPFTGTLEAPDVPGPLKLEITGSGAFTARVGGAVTYDDHPFLVVTWDSYTME